MRANEFETQLAESVRIHGHLCPGQVLGVKMSLLGLRRIDIADPRGEDKKKVIVFVEIDRCATDAIQSVTGCTLGKRTMKFMDYGKMAATFLNLETGRAVRVVAREDIRDKAAARCPEGTGKYQAQLELYRVLPDEELFDVREVEVSLKPQDMPGRPRRRLRCGKCEEYVQDMREIVDNRGTLCRSCAEGGYYRNLPGPV